MKKTWRKPELVVLVRNRPEEAILVDCKNYSVLGAQEDHSMCAQEGCSLACYELDSS